MKNLFFWNEWKPAYKSAYLFLLGLLLLCILSYLFFWLADSKFLFEWDIITQFDIVKVPVDSFSEGLLTYSIDAENYLVKERIFGTTLSMHPWMAYAFFTVAVICLLLGLTIITRTDLIWFAVGAAIFIFFVVNLHTELLKIFGWENKKFSLLIIFLFTGLAFYFQAYDKKFSFIQRFLSFLVLAALTCVTMVKGAEAPSPIFHIANYSIIIPAILTVIFIFSVSYDIICGFLFITGSGRGQGKNSIFHFIFICLLYLTNLIIVYLKKKGIIESDFIHFDLFLILLFSSILGIWEHRRRKFLYEGVLSASLASFLYITIATISFATIAYCFASGNDAFILAFEYAILYSHMGMGILFFLYIIYNFGELFGKTISPYSNMYAPRRFPFFMVRPLGFVIILALFVQSNRYPYKLAQAGYYNFIGDIFYHNKEYKEAAKAYQEGTIYALLNKRSNFSMASALYKLNRRPEAVEYYKNSLERYPTEYAYLNLSNLYIQNDKFFYALFNLKEGVNKFPESGKIHNNIGVLYGSKGLWDSSFYHLNKSRSLLKDDPTPATNLLWFLSRKNFLAEADSLIKKEEYESYMPFVTNRLVKLNLGNQKDSIKLNESFLKDSLLNGRSFAYLYNYIIQDLRSTDTTVFKYIDSFSTNESNISYYHELQYLKALKNYYLGKRAHAITDLKNLSLTSSASSSLHYNRILGFWAMQHQAPVQASEFFHKAIDFYNPESQFNKAIALLEAGAIEEGIEILTPLSKNPETGIDQLSKEIINLYEYQSINEILQEEEEQRVQFLHFRKGSIGIDGIMQLFSSLSDPEYKLLAAAEIMELYLDRNNPALAENFYSDLQFPEGLKKTEARGELNYQYLRLLEKQSKWNELLQATETSYLTFKRKFFLPYFKGVAYWNKGDKKNAGKFLKQALQESPYKDEVYISLADLYNSENAFQKSYDVLLKGITFNEYSPELRKKYALQSLKLNLTSYGDMALEKLKDLLNPAEYSEFVKQYNQEKALIEQQFEQF